MGRFATSTQESAQTFLERLQHEVKFLSYDQIESINNALAKATVVLRASALTSFSLFCNEKYDWDAKESGLPLPLARATDLRDLALDEVSALPDRGFPRLTHLALFGLSTPNFHERVVNFIRKCPQLENIALHEFTLTFANGDVPHEPAPIPLDHLKYVTLVDFSPDALTHYLALLQPRVQGSSVQILGYHCKDPTFPTRFLLPPTTTTSSQDRQVKVCIGVHPTGLDDYSVSLTTISAHTTRRIAAWVVQLCLNGISALEWASLVFSENALAASVDEVWLFGLGSSSSSWKRSPLPLFPTARTVVLAAEGGTHHGGPPDLRLLPFVHPVGSDSDLESAAGPREPNPSPTSTSLTTLRIVHGFSAHDGPCEFAASHGTDGHACHGEAHRDRLSLSRLILWLRSGGFGYLKHLVLQATPHIDVDERELDALRNMGQFETFRFERIEEFPEMPGHSDPAQRGCERYPSALW